MSYIRADETPHVEYLKTVLSEMRDRTFVGTSGRRYPGTDIVGRIWDRALDLSLGAGRTEGMETASGEVTHALDGRTDRDDLLEQFNALGSSRRSPDGTWVDGRRRSRLSGFACDIVAIAADGFTRKTTARAAAVRSGP